MRSSLSAFQRLLYYCCMYSSATVGLQRCVDVKINESCQVSPEVPTNGDHHTYYPTPLASRVFKQLHKKYNRPDISITQRCTAEVSCVHAGQQGVPSPRARSQPTAITVLCQMNEETKTKPTIDRYISCLTLVYMLVRHFYSKCQALHQLSNGRHIV